MTNLPKLLAKLAAIAPEVCQAQDYIAFDDEGNEYQAHAYTIGEYLFYFHHSAGFMAQASYQQGFQGQPARAWLLDSLMQVCEGKGWDYTITKILAIHSVELRDENDIVIANDIDTSNHEALLKALIAALQGNK